VHDDINGDGQFEDADVVLFFDQLSWIAGNWPVAAFDYNHNGRIDFTDVVWLSNHL
jgi:PKD repeat protein